MKLKPRTVYRALLFLLIVAWVWSVWAAVQSNTNTQAAGGSPATNHPFGLERTWQQFEQHPLTFKLDEIEPLRRLTFLGEPLWRYLASLIYILLAFYVAKLLDWVARVWLRRVTRVETRFKELLIELLRGPIKVVLFVVLLHIGLNLFDWPPRVSLFLSKGLLIVVAGSLTYLAVRLGALLIDLWRQRVSPETDQRFHAQLFGFLSKSLTGFIIIVAVLVTAQNLGINITAAITSLSIGGLAMGLAAQDTLANLFGAIAVLVDKPFRVGDQIKVESNEGVVVDVGLRSTRLRNLEGHLVAVPNKTMGNASIINITRRANIKTTMNLSLPQTLPNEKVRRALAILREVYGSHSMTEDLWLSCNQFAGANLMITLMHWWRGTDQQQYLAGMQELLFAAKEQLDREEIRFA